MRNVSNFLIRLSSPWIAALFTLIFLVFSATVLPAQSAAAEAYTGPSGSPDLSFVYAPSDLYRMAEEYGAAGRAAYIRARFTFDLAFPFVYGLFLISAIGWLVKKIGKTDGWLNYAPLLPVLAIIFDLIENAGAAVVVGRYPLFSPFAAGAAAVATPIKWICVGGSFLLLLVLLLFLFIRRIKRKM